MHKFQDQNGMRIELEWGEKASFQGEIGHVWIICRYKGKWLLTDHPKRGYEFPGGKVESGETMEDAARREVWEETGAHIRSLTRIGSYRVNTYIPFVKAIFFAEVDKLDTPPTDFETKGPLIWEGDLADIRHDERFSFMMRDDVWPLTLERIGEQQKEKPVHKSS
ncbi:RNA deprotection pyrophosphohydrolase [Bacillus fonticola]|uniref:RNA deprotection pyrophosphohydrolase n=1 Tax=Bacillus fonticola TaxID=2728853 RepID=UPI001474A54A|nr:nucleoside triphosphatase YtkD [Bacillus fonticola]